MLTKAMTLNIASDSAAGFYICLFRVWLIALHVFVFSYKDLHFLLCIYGGVVAQFRWGLRGRASGFELPHGSF